MKKVLLKQILILGVMSMMPFSLFAWGQLGHRIVGQVAECYLTKKTQKAINEILKGESVAMSSTYADFIKSDSNYNYISKWHYVNIPAGLTHGQVIAQLQRDTSANAYTKINFLVNELKKNYLSMDTKALYIKLLIHIVGDIHQPLHTGRFEDLGGNRVRVNWFNDPYNLHQIWDEVLIEFQQLSYSEYAAAINHTTKAQVKAWQAIPVSEWVYDSYTVVQGIYSDVNEPNEKLGYNYNYKYKAILDNQMLKGGVRLAGLLNSIFQ